MITIDGSEGGGAMLRQALGLSLLTNQAFTITNIRAGRPKPGLNWQHLTALNAAHQFSNAKITGNHKESTEVTFTPNKTRKAKIAVDITTAGSITLLLQTFLLPTIFSTKTFQIHVKGGTDVKWSIPTDYFTNVLLPHFKALADITHTTQKRGYYPKGGGETTLKIKGRYEGGKGAPEIKLTEQGTLFKIAGISHASKELQATSVAERTAERARILLNHHKVPVDLQISYQNTASTGSGITLWSIHGGLEGTHPINPVILGASCLGEQQLKAESVGEEAAEKLDKIIRSEAAVDEHLADQLIPFIGVTGGVLHTNKITKHTKHTILVTEQFLDATFIIEGTSITAQKKTPRQ